MYTKISKSASGGSYAQSSDQSVIDAARNAMAKAAATPPNTTMASVIRKDIKVTGDVVCSGDVQLDGIVEGNIQSRGATISEGAHVHGSVSADTIRIMGSVTGQVRGNTVSLAKSARVIGDILHQSLAIEPGAFVDGQCRPIASSQISAESQKVALVREKAGTQASSVSSNTGNSTSSRMPR